jgi:lipopolysaccharide biosynthesis regulator YciM
MLTTIEIVRERQNTQQTVYRAIKGEQQATGLTPGQALDILEGMLATKELDKGTSTLIILQRFGPDDFFTAGQQARLEELMAHFREESQSGKSPTPEERQELMQLVDAEWQAAIDRAAAIIKQTVDSSS